LDKFNWFENAFKQPAPVFNLDGLLKNPKRPFKATLLVNSREKIIPLPVKEIAYLGLDVTVIQVCTMRNHKYYLVSSLDEMEKVIDPELFFRANRQYLINRNSVRNVERFFFGSLP
jgi:two-component system response regulator LytT